MSARRNLTSKLEGRTLQLGTQAKKRKRPSSVSSSAPLVSDRQAATNHRVGQLMSHREQKRRKVGASLKHTTVAQAEALAQLWSAFFAEAVGEKGRDPKISMKILTSELHKAPMFGARLTITGASKEADETQKTESLNVCTLFELVYAPH